ncbi:unnamed protein product [Arabidopsis thaliana]|uniref:(thale cress) hypothetical protein n=1 Tax=Arabidopsis thaliana TaxID=3702 RepID=A0A7G2E901_ARATH|nr:unnamed protein product [Arabidopsis thaliana]
MALRDLSSSSSSPELHVLAVDDSFVDRKVLERLLKISACKVTTVESGTRALQYLGLDGDNGSSGLKDLKVNLIVTDYSMPGLTGYELLKKIKESSALREIPVVIMSSENIQPRIEQLPHRSLPQFTVKAEAEKEKQSAQAKSDGEASPAATKTPKTLPKKPVYSSLFTHFLKKGQIVRVEKEKYLNSINYLSVGHPPFYKGLDYIYEDRGEVLDLRVFETGEYALVGWVGIPTAPAWLPTDMLIKCEKLVYERM